MIGLRTSDMMEFDKSLNAKNMYPYIFPEDDEFKKNKIIPIRIIAFNKINSGFLLWTGNLINFTFSLFMNFVNSPPLVTIKDLQLFSDK